MGRVLAQHSVDDRVNNLGVPILQVRIWRKWSSKTSNVSYRCSKSADMCEAAIIAGRALLDGSLLA